MTYRVPAEVEPTPEEPAGELLRPTPEDQRSLAWSRAHERNRIGGMIFVALGLLRWGVPAAQGLLHEYAALGAFACGTGGIVLLVYALWSWARPRVCVHSVIRIDDHVNTDLCIRVAKVFTLDVTLQPRGTLVLNPLRVRLLAERAREAGEVREAREVIYSTDHILASGHTLRAEQAVRVAAKVELPEDAPSTSRKRKVAWHIEISAGTPPTFTRVEPLHVRPPW